MRRYMGGITPTSGAGSSYFPPSDKGLTADQQQQLKVFMYQIAQMMHGSFNFELVGKIKAFLQNILKEPGLSPNIASQLKQALMCADKAEQEAQNDENWH